MAGDDLESIQLSDWSLLAKLPSQRTTDNMRKLFYPETLADDLASHDASLRRSKFLVRVDDATYKEIYETILQRSTLQFPDIQEILRVGRAQGKAISQMMNHVVQWISPLPSKGDRVQLWQEFLPAFKENGTVQARMLQRQIFNILRNRTTELSDQSCSDYLYRLPKDMGDFYLERFKLPGIWRDVLIEVRKIVGAHLQGPLVRFNTQDLVVLPLQQQEEPTLIQAVQDAISRLPHVARNPALQSTKALDTLMNKISPDIISWAKCTYDGATESQTQVVENSQDLVVESTQDHVASQNSELGNATAVVSLSDKNLPLPARPGSPPGKGTDDWLAEMMRPKGVRKKLPLTVQRTAARTTEMMKEHHKRHTAPSANNNLHNDDATPPARPKKEAPNAPVKVKSTKSHLPASKTKFAPWMQSPMAK
jgi:hypothetical protein